MQANIDDSANALSDEISRFFKSRRPWDSHGVRYDKIRRLPYGKWLEPSGCVVIFDRDYCPLVRMHPDRTFEPVQSDEFITFVRQEWFYSDKHTHAERLERTGRLIERFELMPEIIRRWKLPDVPRVDTFKAIRSLKSSTMGRPDRVKP